MNLAIHIFPLILSLFCVTDASAQPLGHSLIRPLQPRSDPFTLPNGWIVTPVRQVTLFVPVEAAAPYLESIYTEAIAIARNPQARLLAAVSFQLGRFELLFRADQASLSWIMIDNFCEKMLAQVRRGFPMEYEAVISNDYFQPWEVFVTMRLVIDG